MLLSDGLASNTANRRRSLGHVTCASPAILSQWESQVVDPVANHKQNVASSGISTEDDQFKTQLAANESVSFWAFNRQTIFICFAFSVGLA